LPQEDKDGKDTNAKVANGKQEGKKDDKKKKPPAPKAIALCKYFTTPPLPTGEKWLLFFAFFCVTVNGFIFPSISIVMGRLIRSFDPYQEVSVKDSMLEVLKFCSMIGGGLWVTGFIYYAIFQTLAELIAIRLRGRYLRALMK